MLEQCERASARGVDLRGLCWFPFIDSADWDSLLFRAEGSIDPVGVYSLDDEMERRPTSLAQSLLAAAGGARSHELPAFELQEPVATWLRGYAAHTTHWRTVAPPPHEVVADPRHVDFELRIPDAR